jgi:chemotaxis protein CheD
MSAVTEIAVRMGELAVTQSPAETLVTIGLGSCIGLALVDQPKAIAGLAHIMLPEAIGSGGPPGKFADVAVPELIARTVALGAAHRSLQAVVIGGAQMFSLNGGGSLDIGVRNEEAVRGLLAEARIPVIASATGGSRGRTVRVLPGGAIVAKEAGGVEVELLVGARP